MISAEPKTNGVKPAGGPLPPAWQQTDQRRPVHAAGFALGLARVSEIGIDPLRIALPLAADVTRRGGDPSLFLAVAAALAATFTPRSDVSGWAVRFKVSPAPHGFTATLALAANEAPRAPLTCEFRFPAAVTVN